MTTVVIILGMLVLPVFPQDEPPTTGDTSKLSDAIAEWIRKAEQGDVDAQFHVGFMYNVGEGVPQDQKEAAKWYRLAAKQNDAWAQNNLGVLYVEGEGVPKNYRMARKWFAAAAQHDADALSNLNWLNEELGRPV